MDEYIERELALKTIRDNFSIYFPNVLDAVRRIPTVDVQPINQWISVKDRLPDATYDCLVWYSCDTAFGKCKSWGIAHCSRCDWYTKHLDGDNIEVLYWMPIPEPPQD